MTKPLFSIVLILKNEELTLPRLLKSLQEFMSRGGEVCVCDTGSTDKTVRVAKDAGCKVEEVGEKFIKTINKDLAGKINKRFMVEGEEDVVKAGDRLFDYASARNYASKMASNDMIVTPDGDEIYTKFDIDKIDEAIKNGAEQLEYNFVFSHDQYGNPAIAFKHCKFYNRKKLKWQGRIHEILTGNAKRVYLGEDIIKLEHYQNPSQNRARYLSGLALDCYEHPENDRNSHYFARELLWNDRPKSAIKEFERHIKMNRWLAERGQSMIHIGDCYDKLSEEDKAVDWYLKAFRLDPSRREALMRLAWLYYKKHDAQRTACYCGAALEIPWNSFYANMKQHYAQEPHELMYWATWELGDRQKSRHHWEQARKYQPLNSKYLYDARIALKLPKVSIVIPQLGREDKLKRLLKAIDENANYPDYEVIVKRDSFENNQGVPKMLKQGVAESKGELVMYLGNDCIPQRDFLILAVLKMREAFGEEYDGLVGLNDLYWTGGEFATHWLASKKLLPMLGGEFFHTGYHHNGCDNELTGRCKMVDKYVWCEEAKVFHDHPIRKDFKGGIDEVHKLARKHYKEDRDLLEKRAKEFGFSLGGKFFVFPDSKLSVIMPVKDNLKMTRDAVESLLTHTKRLGELIIIDDGSKEDFKPYIEELKKRKVKVIYHYNKENERGLIKSWNLGAKLARLPYIAFVNNDVLFTPDWEGPLMASLHDGVWLVSPYHTEGKLPDDFPTGSGRHINLPDKTKTGLDWIGSCFMMAKENWMKIGPIDERLKIWCGDNFINERITRDFNRKTEEISVSYIHHFGSQTVGKEDLSEVYKQDIAAHDKIIQEMGWDKGSIPKRIFSIWLNDKKELPPLIKKCVETCKIDGYEHKMITLDNYWKGSEYVNKAIESKNWVKAADFLRLHYLYTEGGIYLDADTEVIKNFDDMLGHRMFVCKEDNGYIANGIVGSVARHHILKDCMEHIESNFKGDDGLIFEAGMQVFTDMVYKSGGVKIYSPEYFLPYNHQTGITNITENTRTFHHYLKSWKEKQPKVAVFATSYNNEKIIEEFVKENLKYVDEVYISDNSSTDKTRKIAKKAGAFVRNSKMVWTPEDYDEGDKKQQALDFAMTGNCEWFLYLDTDEILEERATEFLPRLLSDPSYDAYRLRLPTFWMSKTHYRVDEQFQCYMEKPYPRALFRRGFGKMSIPPKGGHSYPEVRGRILDCELMVKHYSFPDRETALGKYNRYCKAGPVDGEKVKGVDYSHQYEHIHPDYKGVKLEKFREYSHIPPWLSLRDRIENPEKLKVLNVGVGSGESGIAQQLPTMRFKQLDHIDIHKPYLDKAKETEWATEKVNFIHKDIRDYDFSDYDLVIMSDVIEHLPKKDGLKILKKIKHGLIFVPIEKEFRPDNTGVESEKHLSFWSEKDFKGWETEELTNFHGDFSALWAKL